MKTTHQSGFQRTRHAVVVNDPIWQGAQNLSRYAPVIKLDRYADCLGVIPHGVGGVNVLIIPTPATSCRRVVSRDKVRLIGS
jgi:hypothetical protein